MTRRRLVRRTLLVPGGLLVAAAAVVLTQPLWAFDVLAWELPRIVWRVETKEPLVALSFDDGPAPDHNPQVLEILSKHRARATFFLIGDRAAAYPELVARLRSDPPTAYIRWLVAKNLAPGVIVILHDGIADPSRMVAALDSILISGERKGLRFVTIGDLLRARKG